MWREKKMANAGVECSVWFGGIFGISIPKG